MTPQTKLNAATRLRANDLMTLAVQIEGLGIKLHPVGSGSSFQTQGLVGSAPEALMKKLRRFLNTKLGFKAILPKYAVANARTDGVWLGDTKVFVTGGVLRCVFISRAPEGELYTILVHTRPVKGKG